MILAEIDPQTIPAGFGSWAQSAILVLLVINLVLSVRSKVSPSPTEIAQPLRVTKEREYVTHDEFQRLEIDVRKLEKDVNDLSIKLDEKTAEVIAHGQQRADKIHGRINDVEHLCAEQSGTLKVMAGQIDTLVTRAMDQNGRHS